MKKTLSRRCLCAAVLCALIFAGCFTEDDPDEGTGDGRHAPYGSPVYNGDLEGTGSGTHGNGYCTVKIKLTLVDGYITAVSFEETNNTAAIGGKVLEAAPDKIVASNSVEINAVTGATVTRNAIITAGKQALAQIPGYTPEE